MSKFSSISRFPNCKNVYAEYKAIQLASQFNDKIGEDKLKINFTTKKIIEFIPMIFNMLQAFVVDLFSMSWKGQNARFQKTLEAVFKLVM